MKRPVIFLLGICALLVLGSAASGLALATSRGASELLAAEAPSETWTPAYWVYLPLAVRDAGPASWVAVLEEGFESEPGSLWTFRDFDGTENGTYYWARSTCRPYAGSYSAWAVGGGANGALLQCGAYYPNDADSWMEYGPFSLADATAAFLTFRLWMSVDPELNDNLCMYASSADDPNWNGVCLTYQPGDWAAVTLRLDDDLAGLDIRGQSEVWIALQFVSDASIRNTEGVYVDDLAINKCVGGVCPTTASAGPSTAPVRTGQAVVARFNHAFQSPNPGSRPVKNSSYGSGR